MPDKFKIENRYHILSQSSYLLGKKKKVNGTFLIFNIFRWKLSASLKRKIFVKPCFNLYSKRNWVKWVKYSLQLALQLGNHQRSVFYILPDKNKMYLLISQSIYFLRHYMSSVISWPCADGCLLHPPPIRHWHTLPFTDKCKHSSLSTTPREGQRTEGG